MASLALMLDSKSGFAFVDVKIDYTIFPVPCLPFSSLFYKFHYT